jgi:hypothetical protein
MNVKKGFDSPVTGLSNGSSPFVCNKTGDRGVGVGERLLDDQHFGPDFSPGCADIKGRFTGR